jgi:hypothetical protein
VVWVDNRNGLPNLYALRVWPDGTPRDPAAFPISPLNTIQAAPTVTFGGGVFLVAWVDSRDGGQRIYRGRVSPDGVLLDGPASAAAPENSNQGAPALTFDGAQFILGWHQLEGDTTELHAARINPSGTVLDAPSLTPGPIPGDQTGVRLASDGLQTLAVWSDTRSGTSAVYASRVDRSGSFLDGTGFVIANGGAIDPTTSYGGGSFLVVWSDPRNGTWDIYGARVGGNGSVLEELALSLAPNDQTHPQTVFNGTEHVLVWLDGRNGSTDLYGARLSPTGVLGDSTGLALGTDPGPRREPSVATDGEGTSLVLVSHLGTAPGMAAFRAGIRTLGDLDLGSSCTADFACSTGACVMSSCCDPTCTQGPGCCPTPTNFRVGCGCDGGVGPAAVWISLALLGVRRRRG